MNSPILDNAKYIHCFSETTRGKELFYMQFLDEEGQPIYFDNPTRDKKFILPNVTDMKQIHNFLLMLITVIGWKIERIEDVVNKGQCYKILN
jgi:hypothetical protein